MHSFSLTITCSTSSEGQICLFVCSSALPHSLLQPFAWVAVQTLWIGSSPKPHWTNLPCMIEWAKPYLPPVNIIYLPVLSDCLSPHVDACQIERGPEFIDWVITVVAIEGLVEFRLVWAILGRGGSRLSPWAARYSVCTCQCLSFIKKMCVCPGVHARTNTLTPWISLWIQYIAWASVLGSICFPLPQLIQWLQPLICVIILFPYQLIPPVTTQYSSHLCLTEVPAEMPDSNHGVFLYRISQHISCISVIFTPFSKDVLEEKYQGVILFVESLLVAYSGNWSHWALWSF